MADQRQVASSSAYVETTPGDELQVASSSAYVETTPSDELQVASSSAYIETTPGNELRVASVSAYIEWVTGAPTPDPDEIAACIESIATRYEIEVMDTDGEKVALFDDWRGLTINKNLNGIDAVALVLNDTDERVDLFELDGQVRIYRDTPFITGTSKYIEYEGFHRSFLRQTLENGNQQYTSFSRGYNDLLVRRIIGYKAGTIRADKDDVAETVMKEFVNENAGYLAYTALGRLSDGNIAQLQVDTDDGEGPNWSGSRAYRNLLEVLQEISNDTAIDFNVVRIGAAQWEFRTYVDQLGADRTIDGLDSATGKNAAGNVPVVFSVPMGTVTEIAYAVSRTEEINVVYALGRGEGSTRTVVVREDTDAQADSPFNIREISRNGSSQEFTYQLQQFGDKWLTDLAAKEEFSFSPLQQPNSMYGVHYKLGDKVTARYGDITSNKRIVGVDITVNGQDMTEIIELTMADIP